MNPKRRQMERLARPAICAFLIGLPLATLGTHASIWVKGFGPKSLEMELGSMALTVDSLFEPWLTIAAIHLMFVLLEDRQVSILHQRLVGLGLAVGCSCLFYLMSSWFFYEYLFWGMLVASFPYAWLAVRTPAPTRPKSKQPA